MKILKPIVLTFFFLLLSNTVQAQFWKKIEKRAKEAVEEAVIRKTEEKAAEKTEKVIDSIFEMPKKVKKKRKPRATNENGEEVFDESILEDYIQQDEEVDLPESYSFGWKYVMKMESEAYKKKQKEMGDMRITYFLSTESTAFATQFEMGKEEMNFSSLMVMDPSTGVNFTLMQMEGKKIIQKMPSIGNMLNENNEADDYSDNVKIKKIGTKEILGYTCQGFEMQLQEGISTVYINPNAPVSFNHGGDTKFAPKGFDAKWLKEFKNGLMMEMTFISAKNKKQNMKMTCVELVKEPFTVNLNEYKSFMELSKE